MYIKKCELILYDTDDNRISDSEEDENESKENVSNDNELVDDNRTFLCQDTSMLFFITNTKKRIGNFGDYFYIH